LFDRVSLTDIFIKQNLDKVSRFKLLPPQQNQNCYINGKEIVTFILPLRLYLIAKHK